MTEIAICLVSGAALGFLIGLTSVGAGVLTVPMLILVMRFEPITAVGTASLYAVLTKIYATFRHYRQETINLRVGFRFLMAALPGVVGASLLVKWGKASLSPAGVDALQNAVSYLIILAIGFSLVTLLLDYSRCENNFFSSGFGKGISMLFTCFVGAIMGATSIAGILIIPTLLLFYRETTKYVGTSIFVGVLLMLVMSMIYAFLGQDGHFVDVNARVAGIMALGSLVGTHHGSILSSKIDPKRLQLVVVGAVILAAAMMIAGRLRS